MDFTSDTPVSEGKLVTFVYTVSVDKKDESKTIGDKFILSTNADKTPESYVHGQNQIMSGMEKAFEGMKAGEVKEITLAPEAGYGVYHENATKEISKDLVPKEAQKVGAQLHNYDSQGRSIFPRVVDVKDNTIVLDFNHPLAGETVHLRLKVLSVHDAEHKM